MNSDAEFPPYVPERLHKMAQENGMRAAESEAGGLPWSNFR